MMENNGRIELSEAMKDPETAKFIEDFKRYAEKTPFSKMFPKKYENSVKRAVYDDVQELFENNPTMPLKSVVTTVLGGLDDDMPSELLLKMTRVIIENWENASTEVYAENAVEELV
jgi:hypothetical protein